MHLNLHKLFVCFIVALMCQSCAAQKEEKPMSISMLYRNDMGIESFRKGMEKRYPKDEAAASVPATVASPVAAKPAEEDKDALVQQAIYGRFK